MALPNKPKPISELKIAGGYTGPLQGDYQQSQPLPVGYHTNDYAVTGQLSDLPNYDKLTRFERFVMRSLPGITEQSIYPAIAAPLFPGTYLSGGTIPTVGAAMQQFGEGWLGKLLMKLDIPAEGLERTAGLFAQGLASIGSPEGEQEFRDHLGAAWYAGSLAADMANLPTWDKEKGFYSIPTDLPGISGLADARRQIAEYMSQGMDGGEALIKVRDQYYENLGALQLRPQINDAIVHAIGDPLNILLPYIKPVEWAKAKVIKLLNKIPEQEFAKLVPRFLELKGIIAKQTDEVAELGKLVAREGASVEDIAKVTAAADELKYLKKEFALIEAIQANVSKYQLKPWEEKFLHIFGLFGEEVTGTRVAKFRFNPFALTATSRAVDYVETLLTNVQTRLFNGGLDPVEITRSLQRTADGLMSPEFGHHILTVEGRMLRANSGTMAAVAQAHLQQFEFLQEFESPLLKLLAEHLKLHPVVLLDQLRSGKGLAEGKKLLDIVQGTVEGQNLFLFKGLSLDESGVSKALEMLKKIFGSFPVYDIESFNINLFIGIADEVAKSLVTKFGIKARGPIYQISDAIKAAETLAFLKMNPTYPIRNGLNNVFTMLGRGVFGTLGDAEKYGIDSFGHMFRDLGLTEPLRFRQGVGYAGTVGTFGKLTIKEQEVLTSKTAMALNLVNKTLREAEQGGS
ncbi:MAG: hypothetical protein AAB721_00150, partial [Patescibacteria group bacterium]